MLNRLFIILIGIAFVGSTDAYCQNKKYFVWEEQSNNTKIETIIKHIKVFNFFQFNDAKDLILYLENYHMVDIDGDGDYDMIYNGNYSGEGDVLFLFINKNGEYETQTELYGMINSIKSTEDYYLFYIKEPGCCGDYEIRDYKYKFNIKVDKVTSNVLSILIHHENTKPPKTLFDNPVKFEVVNNKTILRVTPEINTTDQFFPREEDGNDYMLYQSGDKGMAFGSQTDITGRIWWYVRMEPNNRFGTVGQMGVKIHPAYIGWMSSTYLEKIGK